MLLEKREFFPRVSDETSITTVQFRGKINTNLSLVKYRARN